MPAEKPHKKAWNPYRGGPADKKQPSPVWQKAQRLNDAQWEKALVKLEKLAQHPRVTPTMFLQGGHLLQQLIQHGLSAKAKQRAQKLLDQWQQAGQLHPEQIP